MEERRESFLFRESNRYMCNEWQWWVNTHQLHEEVCKGGFWSIS
uniref:Uncharacterized protein n=1 Tax=Setaria viridis TaxID=4556 RepID=A0A4U6WH63_SETVI|nr:hypothetical protein SEVIR_1G257233v2 [Setaria viridis]